MHIPSELDFETHLLEYFPGTYGDTISGVIAHSIDDFFDPNSGGYIKYYENNIRPGDYWNQDGAIVKKNRYLFSCRGNGYEHIETYSEVVLSHKVFLEMPILLGDELKQQGNHPKKLLFNTHMRFEPSTKLTAQHSRVLTNNFTRTKARHLTLGYNFDSMLLSACNEYYTVQTHKVNETNWDELFHIFKTRIRNFCWVHTHIPKEKCIHVEDITNLTPDDISLYGDVDEEKFTTYMKQYDEEKLLLLTHLKRKRSKEINENQKLKDTFYSMFEKQYKDFEYDE